MLNQKKRQAGQWEKLCYQKDSAVKLIAEGLRFNPIQSSENYSLIIPKIDDSIRFNLISAVMAFQLLGHS